MSKGRRRPREITADERERLLREGPEVFKQCGVVNYERAIFARLVGESVIGSKNPRFNSMQPRLKENDALAWVRAYSLVVGFLKTNHADETQAAVDMELARVGHARPPPDEPFDGTQDDFDQLLRAIPDGDDSFADRVASYTRLAQEVIISDETSNSGFSPRQSGLEDEQSDGDVSLQKAPPPPQKAETPQISGLIGDDFSFGDDDDDIQMPTREESGPHQSAAKGQPASGPDPKPPRRGSTDDSLDIDIDLDLPARPSAPPPAGQDSSDDILVEEIDLGD